MDKRLTIALKEWVSDDFKKQFIKESLQSRVSIADLKEKPLKFTEEFTFNDS